MQNRYKIEEFLNLVSNHKFIQAHEVLEDDWKELKKIDKITAKFFQALINGTTAIALYLKGREDACLKVWGTFTKNKILIDEINIEDKTLYYEAIKLLEHKYNLKEQLC